MPELIEQCKYLASTSQTKERSLSTDGGPRGEVASAGLGVTVPLPLQNTSGILRNPMHQSTEQVANPVAETCAIQTAQVSLHVCRSGA